MSENTNNNPENTNTSSLRAMVLAAGVGSRLEPLTSLIPKPLIPIGGRPVMEHIVLLLKKHGFPNVISNTHYLGEKIHDYFADARERLGVNLNFVHEEELSGVAGGIRRCADFLKKGTACIIMGDALTDMDLSYLYEKHKEAVKEHGCLVTIAMMQVEDTSQFGVIVTKGQEEKNDKNYAATDSSKDHPKVVSFQEKPKAEEALSSWANTGIYFFEPEVYDFIPNEEEAPRYDVAKDLFPKLLSEGKYMQAIPVDKNTYWADLGNPQQYLKSMQDIADAKVNLDFKPNIDGSSKINENVKFIGVNEIGPNCEIAEGVVLNNCLVWDNVKILSGAKLENCILGSNAVVDKDSQVVDKVLVSQN